MRATTAGERYWSPVSVPPGRYSSSRIASGPSLVSAVTERGTPSAPTVVVATRSSGQAAAMRAAAASCAASSDAVNAGLVIFTTPSTVPGSPAARARKFWSCWLPSGSSATSSPHSAAAIAATSTAGSDGAGSSPAAKKSNPAVCRVIVARLPSLR